MSTDAPAETGDRILAAAETLFARYGYDGVSLRQITAEAGVNLAAVNYHYSDKQSLYLEILTTRLRQVSRTRLEKLAAAEARAGGAVIPVEEIIDILAQPLLALEPAARRLVGRALAEPLPFLATMLAQDFQPAVTRCGQALRRHLPSLPPSDFVWRYSFVVGALHHTAATLHDMKTLTSGVCGNDDTPTALRNFRAFASTALGRSEMR